MFCFFEEKLQPANNHPKLGVCQSVPPKKKKNKGRLKRKQHKDEGQHKNKQMSESLGIPFKNTNVLQKEVNISNKVMFKPLADPSPHDKETWERVFPPAPNPNLTPCPSFPQIRPSLSGTALIAQFSRTHMQTTSQDPKNEWEIHHQ